MTHEECKAAILAREQEKGVVSEAELRQQLADVSNERDGLRALNDKVKAHVSRLCKVAGSQSSIATGYMRDVLELFNHQSAPATDEPAKEVWLDMEELPARNVGSRYRMILNDTPQTCVEIEMEGTRKRWFEGSEDGAYPIDKIQAWLPATDEQGTGA